MQTLSRPTELAVLAERIRAEWGRTRKHQSEAWVGYLNVGGLLAEARATFPGDREYGKWFQEQAFGFSTQWGRRLIQVAENRQAVEQVLESALATGDKPPGVEALLALVNPPTPRPIREIEADPMDHPIDSIGEDEYGTPLTMDSGWVEKETAEHLYPVEVEVRFRFKVPSEVMRLRGEREAPRESLDSEAVRKPLLLQFSVDVRERGWEGMAHVCEQIKAAAFKDEVLRRDWPRIPRHGQR